MRLPTLLSPGALDDLAELAASSPAGGCFVEVGVYKGGSAQRLAEVAAAQGRALYLFDTFKGIPVQGPHDHHQVGDFGDADAQAIRAAIPGAVVVEGVFPESIVPMPPVAFTHIDCDQYASIAGAIMNLQALLMPSGVMLFDDYGCLEGATRAVHDLIGQPRLRFTRCGKAYWVKEG